MSSHFNSRAAIASIGSILEENGAPARRPARHQSEGAVAQYGG
jgi:hypothetical protein